MKEESIQTLKLIPLNGIPIIKSGDDLISILIHCTESSGLNLSSGDILVIAQKIVSKAERRFAKLSDIKPSLRALELSKLTSKDPRLVELILS